jgi:carbamoyltransferase
LGGDHEGKLMGLAAYGKPREGFQNTLVSMMRDFESLWRYDAGNPVWTSLMGNLHASLEFRDLVSAECHDFVASLQGATEQFTQELIDGYMKKLGLPEGLPVCLGGGVAYNCCSNHAMLRRYGRVHVPCSPYDGGLPVGAVLFVWHHILGNTFSGVSEWSPYRGRGVGHADESVASQVVQDLLAGKVVSWYSGRSENGKRALGNRSILADPRIPWMRENLNQRVKLREWYRPFAPSVLSGYAEWADGEVPASPYMSFSCKVSREWATRIPAVVHVDRTCRPQIVTEKANPVYYRVIDLFRQATGIPMVLNTSFNRQEPIVDTPEDALKTFLASGVQVLYINGHRYTQEGR